VFLRSLYARLAAALLALLAALGAAWAIVGAYGAETYQQEVLQNLNRDLARQLIAEGVLIRDGAVDPDALEHVIHVLMVINPGIEAYVLDPDGKVLAWSSPPGTLVRDRVSLEPIRRFLRGDSRLPVLGDDPRDPTGRKVFSAAPIGDTAHPDGWVYVVLGGTQFDSIAASLRASWTLRLAWIAGGAALLVTVLAGLWLFALLTRRLRRLAKDMEAFETRAEPSPGGWNERGGDDIDRVGVTFERMARRIREQVDRLRSADQVRRELVANVSHDLRTPLASLQGYLDTLVLKGDALPAEERRHYLEIAARHATQLGRRVGELFELAKLDAAAVEPSPEPFPIPELVQDIVQKFRLDAESKGIRLEATGSRELPLVRADIGMIERAIENLVANAIRHTPDGGTVSVDVSAVTGGTRVRVSDTGPGIPADELGSVFDRFYRCRTGAEDRKGAGLGLAIARRIVELHGGTLRVDSREGEGTEFSIELPRGRP